MGNVQCVCIKSMVNLNFVLRNIGSLFKSLSNEMTWSNLQFLKFRLAAVWRISGQEWKPCDQLTSHCKLGRK